MPYIVPELTGSSSEVNPRELQIAMILNKAGDNDALQNGYFRFGDEYMKTHLDKSYVLN